MAINLKTIDSTLLQSYGSFSAFVTAIGSDQIGIIIAIDIDLETDSVTLPVNIDIVLFSNYAKFSNGTLSIGKMSARPQHQIFDDTVDITFSYPEIVQPEWYGAVTGTDATTAIQNAVNSINAQGGTLLLYLSSYTINNSISNTEDITIIDLTNSNIFSQITPASVTKGFNLSGFISNGQIRLNPQGGIDIYLQNDSGENLATGKMVSVDSSTEGSVIPSPVDGVYALGFIYSTINNNESGWVTIKGKCNILYDDDGATNGYYVRIPITDDVNGTEGYGHAESLEAENGVDLMRFKALCLADVTGSALGIGVIL